MKRSSLTEKMILYFLALGTGCIIITGFFSFLSARKALLARTYDQLTSVRLTRQSSVESFFVGRLQETAFFAESGENAMNRLTSANYSGYLLFDQEGKILLMNTTDACFSIPMKAISNEISARRPMPRILDYSEATDSCRQLATIARRVLANGDTGILVMILKPGLIDSMMLEVNPDHGLGYSGETYLVGYDHLMRSRSRFIEGSLMHTRVDTDPVKLALEGTNGILQTLDYRGVEVLSSFGEIHLPGLKWVMLAELDYKEATASVYGLRNNIILLSLFTAVTLFILTYTISKRITRPLTLLKDAVAELGEGHLPEAIAVESDDETGELTEAFNSMTVRLREKDEALRAERINSTRSAIDGQDKERQRLSRELHDGIGQNIIGIRLRLTALESSVPEQLKEDFQSVIRITDSLTDEVRATSTALMPPTLAEFGLMPAIRGMCANITDTCGISVNVEGEVQAGLFGRKPVLYIFRIIQEALHNAVRHSGADKIDVGLHFSNGLLHLSVADNGCGFELSACQGTGHGIINMNERVSLLRGTMEVIALPGKGTRIKADIPVNKLQYDKIISG